jgi:membrane-bound lytic murein transglycosylase A
LRRRSGSRATPGSQPIKWTDVAGWPADDHLAAFAAYQGSCQALRKIRNTDDLGPISSALWNVCSRALGLHPQDSQTARTFFEENFQPVRIARLGEIDGFLTGYFEPIVQGSRFPNPEFHFPLYRRPRDLVVAGHKAWVRCISQQGCADRSPQREEPTRAVLRPRRHRGRRARWPEA